jgi:hypothetical protein
MKRKFILTLTLLYALAACSDQTDNYSEPEKDKWQETERVEDVTDMAGEDKTDVTDTSEENNPLNLPESPDYVKIRDEILKIRKDRVIIKTESETDAVALSKHDVFLSAYDVSYLWVIATVDSLKTSLDDLMQIPEVVDAAYGLEHDDGTLQYLTDRICMQTEKGQSPENILAHFGIAENIKEIELLDPYSEVYLITLDVKLGDILQICKKLEESGMCKYAEPPFIMEMKRF